jgi:diketogulonate reductase-like aldo/keto reductase
VVARIAARHGATAAQVALAWVLLHDGVSAIPEAGTREHVAEDRAALDLRLTFEDVAGLDETFPPPTGPRR